MTDFETKLINVLQALALSQEKITMFEKRSAIALEAIVDLLEKNLPRQPAPNYKAFLQNFKNFDWKSINAEVELADNFGVSSVIWQGDRYKRRSPDNAYGAVIFFSRCVGHDSDGKKKYERLITFEPIEEIKVEPISRKVEAALK